MVTYVLIIMKYSGKMLILQKKFMLRQMSIPFILEMNVSVCTIVKKGSEWIGLYTLYFTVVFWEKRVCKVEGGCLKIDIKMKENLH